tara:strand:- start:360 stop:557 length:198 start_codon:yes stop_codon:yes gene_type:complete
MGHIVPPVRLKRLNVHHALKMEYNGINWRVGRATENTRPTSVHFVAQHLPIQPMNMSFKQGWENN